MMNLGYDTVKEILVIRDRYTGIIQSYPSPTKNVEEVVKAVKYSMGGRTIREADSDKARQFVKGMEALKFPSTMRCREDHQLTLWLSETISSSLLPHVEPGEDDVSAWCKLHGSEFKGEKIPFGTLVYFKPSGARVNEQAHKFDPKGIPGAFAG